MSHDAALRRFVRTLEAGPTAVRQGDDYVLSGRNLRAPAGSILELIGSGALEGNSEFCRANTATRDWLRRTRPDADGFAAQHRVMARSAAGVETNLAESPLGRLAAARTDGEAFLGPHHVEAGERVRRLVERAQLQPRVTMSYAASRIAGGNQQSAGDISDLAADARRSVASIHRLLPPDCASAVIDICGMLKGLQQVELERGWPRRSAKLVLRIGLEQLAQHYGLGPFARGRTQVAVQSWISEGARPQKFE